jgi:hypothetical protein
MSTPFSPFLAFRRVGACLGDELEAERPSESGSPARPHLEAATVVA